LSKVVKHLEPYIDSVLSHYGKLVKYM